ncbi:PHP domain-containing protein [[Clostridium] aminophilum]|uniref:Histidinol-phosphatase n=1 Tax=[Clostridium] aminophilum TaxID=1526 RepID=A0A1I6JQM5_9FIRM|nr:PHP domain-containing protein [[Clostridium] aminophilum]SFR81275.1 PHP domain-containing protein [[Clostridium] aminophilum]
MAYKPIRNEIFHVHTWRCKHASMDSDENYVQKALELGADRIVFTDHAPFPGNPFGNRMDIEQLPEYKSSMHDLKSKYDGMIEILCGLEIEYLSAFDDYIKRLRNDEALDVLIMGQHFSETVTGHYSFEGQDAEMEFKALGKGMLRGIERRYFDVIAHPDRIFHKIMPFSDGCWRMSEEIIDCLKQYEMDEILLERNISSTRRKNNYRSEFWEMVVAQGLKNREILGFDSHSVKELQKFWRRDGEEYEETFFNR